MKVPPNPENEAARLQLLRSLDVLDTPAEERFDRITRLAAALFDVPIALVSLVDSERQWFKSRVGLEATETPREISFCGHAIRSHATLAVPNALEDERFYDNPLVTGPPYIRSYYGAPLISSAGYALGTLCVIDPRPRQFTEEQLSRLRDLADLAQAELELSSVRSAASSLAAQSTYLRTVLDTVLDGIVIIDRAGVIQNVNEAVSEIFGYSAEELVGKPVEQLMSEPHRSQHKNYIDRYLGGGQARIIGLGREVEGRRKDGRTFPMDLAVGEMRLESGPQFVGVLRDITERKRMERAKEEFISTVSHELRTPLTSIQGALALVKGKFGSELSAKPRRMLEMAHRNSERLTHLINDLLDLEKIEAGQLRFELAAIEIAPLIHQAIEDYSGFALKHKVTLESALMIDRERVWVDAHRLLQVLANLISNAVKFSPATGRVVVSVSASESSVRVGVRDRGPGIPASFRSRIFQRFSQADSSDSREKGGTGLGLSISKAIIERLGGEIGFNTEEDQEKEHGTEFYFSLPLWTPTISSADSTSSHPRALICEDSSDLSELLAELLLDEDITSDRAASGEEARTLLSNHRYDLLLLDLALPDADGLELLDEIKRNPSTESLPVIIVSGRAEERRSEVGDLLSVIDWISKPLDQERLVRALRSATQRSERPKVLQVENSTSVMRVTGALLEEWADLHIASSLPEAYEQLAKSCFDLVLLNLDMAQESSEELIERIKCPTPVVIMSRSGVSKEVLKQACSALAKPRSDRRLSLSAVHELLNKQ